MPDIPGGVEVLLEKKKTTRIADIQRVITGEIGARCC